MNLFPLYDFHMLLESQQVEILNSIAMRLGRCCDITTELGIRQHTRRGAVRLAVASLFESFHRSSNMHDAEWSD